MEIKTGLKAEKMIITKIDRLDPITVYYEDFGPGQGQITILCYDKVWKSFWGSMGKNTTILDFFVSCDVGHVAKNLSRVSPSVVDYDKISADVGVEITQETLMTEVDRIVEVYGDDWQFRLPETTNHEYEYLCRIIKTVQKAIKS